MDMKAVYKAELFPPVVDAEGNNKQVSIVVIGLMEDAQLGGPNVPTQALLA